MSCLLTSSSCVDDVDNDDDDRMIEMATSLDSRLGMRASTRVHDNESCTRIVYTFTKLYVRLHGHGSKTTFNAKMKDRLKQSTAQCCISLQLTAKLSADWMNALY